MNLKTGAGGAGRKTLVFLLFAGACTAIGLFAGWMARGRVGQAPAAGHAQAAAGRAQEAAGAAEHDHGAADHDHDHEGAESKEHDHGAADHEHDHGHQHLRLSPQAAANLGIKSATVKKASFQKFISIPAVVVEAPQASRPIYSPLSGRILDIRVVPGGMIEPCAVLMTILRDAVPRPSLTLTEEVLKPANEDSHRSLAELRKAVRNVELVKAELERVRKFTESGTQEGLPVLPRKNLFDLQYEQARAEKDVEIGRAELKRHGLTDEEVKGVEEGGPAPIMGLRLWRRGLEQAGIWTPEAQAVEKELPSELRNLPWAVATVAELAAAGLATNELVAWLHQDPAAARRFLEIAALLQKGETLSHVRRLHEQGALDPIIEVRAPDCEVGRQWDLSEVVVKPGEHVEAGARLAVVNDATVVYLRATATGRDTSSLLDALKRDVDLAAVPLSAATAPSLKGLRITRISSPTEKGESEAALRVSNEVWHVHTESESRRFRTWQLRSGQKYMLRVPTQSFDGVFVLPAAAVTDDGPDKIVFVSEEGAFVPAKVVVLHQDNEVAVIDPERSEIPDDVEVVQQNAFALGLALRAMTGPAADPHAGHQH